jgi:hypothetical protein
MSVLGMNPVSVQEASSAWQVIGAFIWQHASMPVK